MFDSCVASAAKASLTPGEPRPILKSFGNRAMDDGRTIKRRYRVHELTILSSSRPSTPMMARQNLGLGRSEDETFSCLVIALERNWGYRCI